MERHETTRPGLLDGRRDFWDGVAVSHGRGGADAREGAAVVVLPAYVEHQPRALLAAAAAGVPVIASEACGLHDIAGIVTIPTGDAGALTAAMDQILRRSESWEFFHDGEKPPGHNIADPAPIP